MQILLSCAKTMADHTAIRTPRTTEPRFQREADAAAAALAALSVDDLARLLHVNRTIAAENRRRIAQSDELLQKLNEKILEYTVEMQKKEGDVNVIRARITFFEQQKEGEEKAVEEGEIGRTEKVFLNMTGGGLDRAREELGMETIKPEGSLRLDMGDDEIRGVVDE